MCAAIILLAGGAFVFTNIVASNNNQKISKTNAIKSKKYSIKTDIASRISTRNNGEVIKTSAMNTDMAKNRSKKYSIKTDVASRANTSNREESKKAIDAAKSAIATSEDRPKSPSGKKNTVQETKIIEMQSKSDIDDTLDAEKSENIGKSKKEIFVNANMGRVKEIEVNSVNFVKLKNKAHEIFIPNPDVADVQLLSDNSLYLMGLSPGCTSLVITDKDDNVMLDCKIKVTYPLKAIREAILEMHPDTDVEIVSVDNSILLKGKVPSPEIAANVQEIVSRFVDTAKIINKLSIETATQVMLKVKIAEVARDITKNIGVSWRALSPNFSDSVAGISYGFTGGGAIAALNSDALESGQSLRDAVLGENGILSGKAEGGRWFARAGGAVSDLTSVIDALAGESFATILAEPTIIALSGKKATFKSGGEQGYTITQPGGGNVTTTEFKEWGTSIEFTPIVLSEDRINITVTPKVSTLVTQSGSAVPSLTSKEATTTVELGSGQSLAIAGLLQKTTDTTASETPLLSEIPLIGTLFRNSYIKKIEKELVIIVTPYIVKPSSKPLKAPTDMVPVICSPVESILSRKFFRSTRAMKLGRSTGYTIK
jgi:pilus assembly protein CpaC